MRSVIRLVLGFALIVGLASSAQAGQVTISFSFNASGNEGNGTLSALWLKSDASGDLYSVTSGTLTDLPSPRERVSRGIYLIRCGFPVASS